MNKQDKQTKGHRHRQQYGGDQREGGWGQKKVKDSKDTVTKEDLTLGGKHTMQ